MFTFRQWAGLLLIAVALLDHSGLLPFSQGGGGFFAVPLRDAWFVVIEESSERPSYLASLITDMELWNEVEAIGAGYRIYDKDLDEAAPYVEAASKDGLPGYVFSNGKNVLRSGKLPETREGVLAIVNQQW